jgi:hypothetical protein
MTDKLLDAIRNCLTAVKGAGLNPPSCFKSAFHERNLTNFGNAVAA